MKQLGRASALLGFATWALSPACSLVVDPDPLQRGCATGTKPCEVMPGQLRCVSVTDAEYGCARESCVPCTLGHAVEVCGGDGDCAIGTCEPDFENCDFIQRNGCEEALDTSYAHCGRCSTSCADALRDMPRALTAQCSAGRCLVKECQDGYADCDGAASNGCEKPLPAEACGRCAGCPGTTACNLETRRCE